MSSRLTLLFVCNARELYPVLISALESADFHVLVAHTKDQANALLKEIRVDAVLIHQSEDRPGHSICAALKRRAPRTPILLFADEEQQPDVYPGIYSVLHADSHDEVLTRAVAVFLRQSLSGASAGLVKPAAESDSPTARKPGVQQAV